MNDLPPTDAPHGRPPGLPPELERFGAQLERAAARDLAPRRRRRVLTGLAAAACAAAAIYAGVALLGGSGRGPGDVPTASALDKAAAALTTQPGTILHVRMIGIQDNGDGTTVTWQDESWQSTTAPYQRRQVEQAPDEPRSETGTVDGVDALYDAATDTVYVDGTAPAQPQTQAAPTPSPTEAGPLVEVRGVDQHNVTAKLGPLVQGGSVSAAQLRTVQALLRKVAHIAHASRLTVVTGGKAAIVTLRWTVDGKPQAMSLDPRGSEAVQGGSTDDGSSGAADEVFRQQALAALKASTTSLVGHVTVDGRDALKIVVSPSVTYLVDAQTYDPIEWITRGTDGSVTLRFAAFEQLQPTADNLDLLSLTAQHAGAHVDSNASDYESAMSRLFPHG